jgi:hypothetical protein
MSLLVSFIYLFNCFNCLLNPQQRAILLCLKSHSDFWSQQKAFENRRLDDTRDSRINVKTNLKQIVREVSDTSSQKCPTVCTPQRCLYDYQQTLNVKSQKANLFSSTIPTTKIHATFHNLNCSLKHFLFLATFSSSRHPFHFVIIPIKPFIHSSKKWQDFANILMKLWVPQKAEKYLHQLNDHYLLNEDLVPWLYLLHLSTFLTCLSLLTLFL